MSERDWNRLRRWHHIHGRHDLPWRRSPTPWNILVAEMLLHRTRAKQVHRVYEDLVKEFPAPDSVVASPERFMEMAASLGLVWRAKAFADACVELVFQYGGEIPIDRRCLESLSGVGHYIAAAVRCFGFGLPEVVVDTNTVRLASRISGEGLDVRHHRSGKIRARVMQLCDGGVPAKAPDNYCLLDLAAEICLPRQRLCKLCPVETSCATGRTVRSEAHATSMVKA